MKYKGYVLATVLGAIGGGVAAALITNAIPKLMQQMEIHMQTMMAHMEEKGIDTSEMCPRTGCVG
jgi:outer membrane lipoprotein SlyB